jgi:hypothetical protein
MLFIFIIISNSANLFSQQIFQTNNVVQLVSRASGRSLQIIMSPTQQLVIDGAGQEGPQAFNSKYPLSFHISGLKRPPII